MEAAFAYKPLDKEEEKLIKQIISKSLDMVYDLGWIESTPLVLKYFDYLLAAEDPDSVKDILLKTIKTLGKLETREAAVRLNLYIELINNFVRKNLDFDEDLLKEVIISLGALGDMVAYDNLSDIEKIGYSDEIISLSKEAISRLKVF